MNQSQTQLIGEKFEIIQQLPSYHNGINQYLCRNQLENQQEYISIHLKKSTLKFQNLKVIKIKHFNIFKPIDWYNQKEEFVLIYDKCILDELKKTQEKTQKKIINSANTNNSLLQRLVLQLCFVMRELQERGYPWNFLQLSHLYFIDEFVMLDISQFDFSASPNTLQSFRNFKRNIQTYFQSAFVSQLDQCKDFQEITQKAFELTQIYQSPSIEPPFRNLLQFILGTSTQDETVLTPSMANSVVYKIKTPNLYKQQGINTEFIVVKSTKIRGDEQQVEYIKKNIQTELEMLEELSVQDQYFCACIGFYRLFYQVYLLSPFYKRTLQDYFNEIMNNEVSNDQFNTSIVYKLALQFAQALEQLHNFKIIHRDLKPDNLFLTEQQINDPRQQLIIADFDRSKAAYSPQQLDHQTIDQFTQGYQPPDDNNNQFSYDIWQYGAICYQLACKGNFHLARFPSALDDDGYLQTYGKDALEEHMKVYNNYKDEFVKLLAKCLDINPSQRPSSQELCQIVKEIKNPIQIQVIDIEFSQSYGNNCFRCW